MPLSSSPASGPSIIVIEAGLSALAAAVAFGWLRLGSSSFFLRIERVFARLARKQGPSVIAVGLAALLLRLALLPLFPIPLSFSPNNFSFLLAAGILVSSALMCGHLLNAVGVDAAHLGTHTFRASTFVSCIRFRSVWPVVYTGVYTTDWCPLYIHLRKSLIYMKIPRRIRLARRLQ